jgi:hypothetical protein
LRLLVDLELRGGEQGRRRREGEEEGREGKLSVVFDFFRLSVGAEDENLTKNGNRGKPLMFLL